MSFRIPDHVRDRFEAMFAGRDTSAIVTGLLARAIALEERRRQQPPSLIERLRGVGDAPAADEPAGRADGCAPVPLGLGAYRPSR